MRKYLLIVSTTLVAFLLTELAVFAGYRLLDSNGYSHSKLMAERQDIVTNRERESQLDEVGQDSRYNRRKEEILHPYLGYVIDYHDPECPEQGFCDRLSRNLPNAPLTPLDDNDFSVAIFGGSFAHQLPLFSTEGYLQQQLKSLPGLEARNIVVFPIALGGYKQPQQLMAVNWFLSLGARFDLVINIDGFNEVALPPVENLTAGTNPFFPASGLTG